MNPAGKVLLIGSDENLLRLRGKVLYGAGFDVIEALTYAQVANALDGGEVRIAVLCHTLRDSQLEETLDQLQAMRGALRTILMGRSMTGGDERALEFADEVVTPIGGPSQLIAAAKRLL